MRSVIHAREDARGYLFFVRMLFFEMRFDCESSFVPFVAPVVVRLAFFGGLSARTHSSYSPRSNVSTLLHAPWTSRLTPTSESALSKK